MDFVTLALQLRFKFLDEFTLLLKPLFLLSDDCFFNFFRLFREIFENFTLLLDSCIFLGLQVHEVFVHLSVDWSQLVVQTLNSIVSLLCEQVLEVGHAVVATLGLTLLVFVLGVELVFHLDIHFLKLLIIPDLVDLQ